MQNPFQSEDAAFRFVLGTIVYFALIVTASLIATWLALLVFLVLTGVALARLRGSREEPLPHEQIESVQVEDTLRVLVVANETLDEHGLRDELLRMSEGFAEDVLVVCPVHTLRAPTETSNEAAAREAAASRLAAAVAAFQGAGLRARGEIGDGDPLQALEDALRTFSADAVVISTHPEGSSKWLERGVVAAARVRFHVPITHVSSDARADGVSAGHGRPPIGEPGRRTSL